jgi:hypothetical protein
MSLLSDDEEWNLWNAQGIDDMNQAEAIAFARAYAAAILAKLASAELPEPYAEEKSVFEDWLHACAPSGDAAEVHAKWLVSYEYRAFVELHEFTAAQLHEAHAQGFAAGAAAQLAEKPSGYLSQHNLEMLRQGYPQTIVMLEGAKRDTPLYTRREAK